MLLLEIVMLQKKKIKCLKVNPYSGENEKVRAVECLPELLSCQTCATGVWYKQSIVVPVYNIFIQDNIAFAHFTV